MKDIKTKENKIKNIKTLDKTKAWTERIKDPAMYLNEKVKDNTTGNTNAVDYASDKLKYEANRAKDEAEYLSKKGINKTRNSVIERKEKKIIKEKIDGVKTKEKIEKIVKSENKKFSKKITEQGKRLAISIKEKTIKGSKKIFNSSKSAIKGMIAGLKSLVSILLAGGFVLMIPIKAQKWNLLIFPYLIASIILLKLLLYY